MKREIWKLLEFYGRRLDGKLKRKLLIAVGAIGMFVLVSGITVVYLGYRSASYLMSQAPTGQQLSVFAADLKDKGWNTLSLKATCLTEIQSHLNPSIWLSQSIMENATKLHTACFAQPEHPKSQNDELFDGENSI